MTAPFERIIILKQTDNPVYRGDSIPKMLVKMLEKEGFSSYFKGNGVNVCRIFPFSAIELYTFEIYKQQFSHLLQINSEAQKKGLYLLAGAASGITAATFVKL
jgi:Mitochondrial carrier protein.